MNVEPCAHSLRARVALSPTTENIDMDTRQFDNLILQALEHEKGG
jgi:hypothetical protein